MQHHNWDYRAVLVTLFLSCGTSLAQTPSAVIGGPPAAGTITGIVAPANGGTGVANANASTLTLGGPITFTASGYTVGNILTAGTVNGSPADGGVAPKLTSAAYSIFANPTNATAAPIDSTSLNLSGIAANTVGATMAGYSLTGSNTQSLMSLSGTINTSGSPDVLLLSITDTARGGSTKFLNLKGGVAGATSEFSVDNVGALVTNGTATLDANSMFIGGTNARGYNSYVFGWTNSGSANGTIDTGLSRDAGGVVDVGTGAQGSVAGSMKMTNITLGGQITAQSMTQSAAAQSGTVCNNTAGTLTYDATLGCLASAETGKDISGPLPEPLAKVMALSPIQGTWKTDAIRAKDDPGNHFWLGAYATGYVAEELIARDVDGNPRGWRQDAVIATLVGAVQEQQRHIVVLQLVIGGLFVLLILPIIDLYRRYRLTCA